MPLMLLSGLFGLGVGIGSTLLFLQHSGNSADNRLSGPPRSTFQTAGALPTDNAREAPDAKQKDARGHSGRRSCR